MSFASLLRWRTDSLMATRQAPLWTLIAAVVVTYAYAALVQLYVPRRWLTPLSHATHGLMNATLQVGVVILLLEVGGLILLCGRLRFRDVGLRRGTLGPAVLFTLALWAAVNLLDLAYLYFAHTQLSFNATWTQHGLPRTLGDFLGQIFGNALCEEIVFRGFLMVQIVLLLRRLGAIPALVLGVVAAQAVFALGHVPLEMRLQHPLAELGWILPKLFVFGVGFAVIYLATDNLLMAVGAHALSNYGMLILAGPGSEDHSEWLYLALALVLSLMVGISDRSPGGHDSSQLRPMIRGKAR